MDLLGYFRMLRRRWALVLFATILGGALGVASSALSGSSSTATGQTFYKGTNTLVLDTSSRGGGGFQSAFQNLDQIAILTTTGDVPSAVAKKLGVDTEGLTNHIITTTDGNTNTLEITAVERSAGAADALADTFADELIANLGQRDTDRYNNQKQSLSDRVNSLNSTVAGLRAQLAASPTDPVVAAQLNAATNELGSAYSDFGNLTATGPPAARLSVLEKAQSVPIGKAEYDSRLNLGALGQNHLTVGTGTAQPVINQGTSNSALGGKVARGLFGALIGLLVGIGLAIMLERLNRRIRTHEDAEEAYGLPVLAEVPRMRRKDQAGIVAAHAPLSRAAEAFRAVRSSLLFARATMVDEHTGAGVHRDGDTNIFEPDHDEPFVVMITSAAPAEGKSTTTANLATVFAESGSSVLVVNCDFRRPSIHTLFGVDDEPRRVLETQIEGVKVVTNVLTDPGANPSQVVAAQRQVVAAARGRFDVILLDTAPLLTANDAVELVGSADIVLLVARSEETLYDNARRAAELLQRLDVPLAGVVLSAVKGGSNEYYYYYQPDRAHAASESPAALGGQVAPQAHAATDGSAGPVAGSANGTTNGSGASNGNVNGAVNGVPNGDRARALDGDSDDLFGDTPAAEIPRPE
jgi:Mrp family chromosome partitioning ATPase/capsular polysaccharide biosynthesis protein